MNLAPFLLDKARFGYRLGDGDARRRDRPRRPVVRDRGLPHGHPRRARRDQGAASAARTRTRSRSRATSRRSRRSTPAASTTSWRRSPIRDAKGRETVGHARRGPAPRHHGRGARAPRAGVRPARRATDRGSATRRDGTVTAGNAPGITDGAAATVVASERAVERHGLKPLARIVGYAQAEVAPQVAVPRAGPGRPPAPRRGSSCRSRRSTSSRSTRRSPRRRWPTAASSASTGSKVNVNGGAIALGHPIGASAARGSWRRCSTSCSGARAATGWRRCASAAAAPSRWRSSGSERRPARRTGRTTRGTAIGDPAMPTRSRSTPPVDRPSPCAEAGRRRSGALAAPDRSATVAGARADARARSTRARRGESVPQACGDRQSLRDARLACHRERRPSTRGRRRRARRPSTEPPPTAAPPTLRPVHRRRVGRIGVSGETFESLNPADTRDVIGRFQAGTAADVAMAVRAAEMALPALARDPGAEARRDPVPLRRSSWPSTRSASRGR